MVATIVIFFICSLINVVLSTLKTILTVTATKRVAAIINAVTYGFYAIVVKQLASLDITITVIVTIATNLLGVYISMWIIDKTKKDNLWKINITTSNSIMIKELETCGVSFNYVTTTSKKHKQIYIITAFSKSQQESIIIRDIVKKYDCNFNVVEVSKTL